MNSKVKSKEKKDSLINYNETSKPTLKGLLFLFIAFMSYIAVPQLIGSYLYYKLDVDETVAVVIGNICLLILYVVLFYPTLKKQFKEYFSDKTNFFNSLKYWGIAFGVMVFSNFIINVLIMPDHIAENETLNREFLQLYPVIAFFEIGIIGPFIEEMIFRFSMRKAIGKNKYFPLISALIFGLLHSLTGITTPLELLYIIPYGALGYGFAYLYNKTDNIFSSAVAHIIHNTLSFILILIVI